MKINILAVLLLFTSFFYHCSEKEEPLILNEGKIHNDLHKSNIGKVTFMKEIVPFDQYSEKDFLTSINLKDDIDFNIRTFLGKTLTYYLHQLAPELTVNQLCKQGNYQFTFYVDGNKIYTENLNPGAGSPSFKNSMPVFRVPLLSTSNEDSWGRFMWMRFMQRGGGNEALTEGSHDLKIEIRPYIESEELKVGELIAEGTIKLYINKIKVNKEMIAVQEIKPTPEWELSDESYDIKKIEALNKKIAQKDFKKITSFVVIKNGKLLVEEYFNDAKRKTLHNTRSVGKTFASTVMGIAIKEGHIKSEKETLDQFYDLKKFKNHSSEKEKVTLKSLLSMSSGFDADDFDMGSPGNEENMYPTDDWVKFALDLPMDPKKVIGKNWNYFTAGIVVLGDILHQSVPGGLEKYADEKLFNPLNIKKYKWQYTPQKVANTAGGLQLSSLDYAKFGQLYKNGGKWKDKQIIPENWVNASLDHQIKMPEQIGGNYGYLFWNKKYEVDNKSYEVFYASGNGGNKIFVFKDLPLVVVVTATAYGQAYGHAQVDKMMKNYILPAVLNGEE